MDTFDSQAIAAWWGAILATIVFVWEIFKWSRSGARLLIHIAPNMQMPSHDAENQLHLVITVSNIGNATTTITHLFGCAYTSGVDAWRDKRANVALYPPDQTVNYPHTLEPGQNWTAWLPQTKALEHLRPYDRIKVGVLHSMAKKAVRASVINAK